MAGAGYRLFNTGDVLTAAQVNTYLQQQVIMVFADSTARTTALSGVLAEGMFSYLTGTNAFQLYNGSSWVDVSNPGDITAVNVTSPITGGGSSGDVTIGVSAASTSASGVVQLSDSTSTTSSVLASTPTATKSAYDLAASAYAPAFTNNYYAGKNKIINGDFGVWQRGTTSGAVNTAAAYQADRWKFGWAGTGTGTVSQQTFTPGAAPVAGYESSFFQRFAVNTVGSSTDFDIYQPIEDVRTFAGQTVTFSFWAKADSARTITVFPFQVFGTGGSAAVGLTTSSVSVTTSWARYSATIAVPSISGKTIGTNSSLNFGVRGTFASSLTLDIWGVQLEAGSVATPFQTASGSIGGELALCQRYFQYLSGSGNTYIGTGYARTTTRFDCFVPLIVTMRSTPSVTATGQLVFETGASGTITSSSVNLSEAMKTGIALYMVCTGTTNGYGGLVYFSTSASLAISAEI